MSFRNHTIILVIKLSNNETHLSSQGEGREAASLPHLMRPRDIIIRQPGPARTLAHNRILLTTAGAVLPLGFGFQRGQPA